MRFSKKKVILFNTLVIALGCVMSCSAAYRTPVTHSAVMENNQVTMLGFSNVVTTSAVSVRSQLTETGHMRVQLQLIKEYFGSTFVEIKVFFIDNAGFEIETTNWEPVHLVEDVITQYETVSLSREPTDFRVVIRRPPDD